MACIQAVGGGSVGSFCTRLKRGKDTLESRSQIGAFRNCHMGSRKRISVISNASGEKGSKMEAGSMHRVPKGIRTTKGSVGSSMKATDPALGTVQTGEEKEVRPLQQIKLPKVNMKALSDQAWGFVTPQSKGDAKDIFYCSLSFAVLVYMSQKLVCAYCALQHLLGGNAGRW